MQLRRDGEMLVVTKIDPMCGGSCAECVDLQAVRVLKFFGEFYTVKTGCFCFTPKVLYLSP